MHDIRDLKFTKFLRSGERIVYGDCDKQHIDIAFEHNLSYFVDDGGYIEPNRKNPNQVAFVRSTKTCNISGNPKEQRYVTLEVARKILGKHNVAESDG